MCCVTWGRWFTSLSLGFLPCNRCNPPALSEGCRGGREPCALEAVSTRIGGDSKGFGISRRGVILCSHLGPVTQSQHLYQPQRPCCKQGTVMPLPEGSGCGSYSGATRPLSSGGTGSVWRCFWFSQLQRREGATSI